MTENYYKLFGLNSGADLDDVKKAYRKLAKKHHPDRFADESRKRAQEKIMARINEAYKAILEWLGKPEPSNFPENRGENKKAESDYSCYKKGVEIFNSCYEGVLIKMEQHDIQKKEDNLRKAKVCFEKVLDDYPDSDWAYDSGEKIRKIDKMLKNIGINETNKKTSVLPKKDPSFYERRFKEMFRK